MKSLKERRTIRKNKKLIKKYPFLYPKNIWSGEDIDDYDYTWTLYPEDMGWFKGFGDMMLDELRQELIKKNFLNEYKIIEIKSKFGELRWYANMETETAEKYSLISRYCCECCGKPDVGITNGYWIMPICKDCFHKVFPTQSYDEGVNPPQPIPDTFTTLVPTVQNNGEIELERKVIDIKSTMNKIRERYKNGNN